MIKRFIVLLSLMISLLFGSKDHYFQYIGLDGKQLSLEEQRELIEYYDTLTYIDNLILERDFREALKYSESLIDRSFSDVIKSEARLRKAETLLRSGRPRDRRDGDKFLKNAILDSKITEESLPKAYMLVIDYKLALNQMSDAKYFAKKIMDSYDGMSFKNYGTIYLAKIYFKEQRYKQAEKLLGFVLSDTTDINIASKAADLMFEVYIATNRKERARKLLEQVVMNNVNYFVENRFEANSKIDVLIKQKMYDLVIQITKALISDKTENNRTFLKYKLARAYMFNLELEKAKEVFIEVMNIKEDGEDAKFYRKKAKISLDEVLLRQGQIEPEMLLAKYKDSKSMIQKIYLQELLNLKRDNKYGLIFNNLRKYRGIAPSVAEDFGFSSVAELLQDVNIGLVREFIDNSRCEDLSTFFQDNVNVLLDVLRSTELRLEVLNCVSKYPYPQAFEILRDKFFDTKDPKILYTLETMAINLKLYMEAYRISRHIERMDNVPFRVKQAELIPKFDIMNNLGLSIKRTFFEYVKNNPELLENNKDPRVLDIYYQYYNFLLSIDNIDDSEDILKKLYTNQKRLNLFIYSPFVDLKYVDYLMSNKEYELSIDILNDTLKIRNIDDKDSSHIYYLLAKNYALIGNESMKIDSLTRCQEVDVDSFWKQLCTKMDR